MCLSRVVLCVPSLLRRPGSAADPLPAGAGSVVPWLLLGKEMRFVCLEHTGE